MQFSFDEINGKSFSIVDFTDKKNPDIIEDSENINFINILSKRKFPEFYSNIIYDTIQYQVYENDDDGNYDTKTNIELIKSGDYGYPITYESQYSISDYEFTSNLDVKEQIENIILKNILTNLKKYI